LQRWAKLGIPGACWFHDHNRSLYYYYQHKQTYPGTLQKEVNTAMKGVEKLMGMKFGDAVNPLLISVRSGARKSMPGMMETVLNVGLCHRDDPRPHCKDKE